MHGEHAIERHADDERIVETERVQGSDGPREGPRRQTSATAVSWQVSGDHREIIGERFSDVVPIAGPTAAPMEHEQLRAGTAVLGQGEPETPPSRARTDSFATPPAVVRSSFPLPPRS